MFVLTRKKYKFLFKTLKVKHNVNYYLSIHYIHIQQYITTILLLTKTRKQLYYTQTHIKVLKNLVQNINMKTMKTFFRINLNVLFKSC